MDEGFVLDVIKRHYDMEFERIEFIRESGCFAYAAYTSDTKYFLRVTKPMFSAEALNSINIQLYLQENSFPVPQIILTKHSTPYARITDDSGEWLYTLYEYIDGHEPDPELCAEELGSFIGKLHRVMKGYRGTLPVRDKHFYIGRYIDILRKKAYHKTEEFAAYGEKLWNRICDLPMGPCHGDMYRGNILQTDDGKLYLLDFDTFCIGFTMYDPTLICNITDYFNYTENGLPDTMNVYHRFLPHYESENHISQEEADSMCDLMALYHFALQATIIELYGLDCVSSEFLDKQLDWLYKWEAQCHA